ncbi:MAG: formylmethanofuran--tetrahydromethanopterin N-formyltransferase [Planctomycetes bacterium]|nr:formylmethanofuran--tetrahydromethanopterin N-formyltransferase [Planctomycetota bacterium]MBL7043076.1 formylmethanofuran--tetrahydromethanopterin N-formyltransferase [Pirellulaceae bacterium]
MQLGATSIQDTFAEAFGMRFARLLITAHDDFWLEAAVREITGYSSSVIACDAETGLERRLSADVTPDGRPGAMVLVFGFSREALAKCVPTRIGQCVMTCPTTAVYDGLPDAESRVPLGKHLRFFGDGFQKSKLLDGKRYWRIPVMDGEFLVQEDLGIAKGVGGGNIIIQTQTQRAGLAAARRAVEALADMDGVIAPFPGGVARSGSKVGSRYKGLPASTADAFCPTLRGRVESKLHSDANCAYEVVIDGVSEGAVAAAMTVAIRAAAAGDVIAIGAGNYGGKLGKYQFHLHELLKS